ncbi:TPA: serine hydrolase [Bacillus cereus]|nr:serine hydrolase [Bacillus cereus]HDV8369854.1 serine hydrolase [Bacillus cereus]
MFINVLLGIVVICIVVLVIVFMRARKDMNTTDPQYILSYIKENAQKNTCALIIKKNDEILCSINEDKRLPLASMVKLIIAIEFAKQSANGIINENEYISLSELKKYYIKNTDGGAHPKWEQDMIQNNQIKNDCVTLHNIARGMLQYSSNANTEYLINILGIENINQNIKELGLKHHEEVYPFVSALYIPGFLQEKFNLSKKELVKHLNNLSQEEYKKYAFKINELMKNEHQLPNLNMFSLDLQKNWSNRLTSAAASDYISLLEKINSKNYYDELVHQKLDKILETVIENEHNKKLFLHAGQKGGSTAFVLTNGLYATNKKGDSFEIVFMANELNRIDAFKLRKSLNEFNLKILKNEEFRGKIKMELA